MAIEDRTTLAPFTLPKIATARDYKGFGVFGAR